MIWWRQLDLLSKQGSIIVACVMLNVGCFFAICKLAQSRAENEYLIPFQQADRVMESMICRPYPHLSSFRTEILQNQYFFLQHKKDFFETRLIRFYVAYIGIMGCSLIMTLLLAGLLALISRQGWVSTNQTTRFVFVMVALFTTLYASLLTVFDLEKNALNNLQLFNEHKSVQIDIYDFLTTSGQFIGADSTKAFARADTMIHGVNLQIKSLNRVFYSIDQSPIKDVSVDEFMKKVNAGQTKD